MPTRTAVSSPHLALASEPTDAAVSSFPPSLAPESSSTTVSSPHLALVSELTGAAVSRLLSPLASEHTRTAVSSPHLALALEPTGAAVSSLPHSPANPFVAVPTLPPSSPPTKPPKTADNDNPFPPVHPWCLGSYPAHWTALASTLSSLSPRSESSQSAFSTFPLLLKCHSFADIIAVSQHLSTKSSFDQAEARAAELISQGVRIDDLDITYNLDAIADHGLESLFRCKAKAIAHRTLQPNSGSALLDKMSSGVPLILDPAQTFQPNNGIGVTPLPFAPPTAVFVHHCLDAINGRTVLVPLDALQVECARLDIPFHVSACFIADKQNVDLGRLIPWFVGINDPVRKAALADQFGPIHTPSLADICSSMLNAIQEFPDQPSHDPLVATRQDISDAFQRVQTQWPSCLLLCMLVVAPDGKQYASIPVTQRWAEQSANYSWQPVADFLESNRRTRLLQLTPLQISNHSTDDFTKALPQSLADAERIAFAADACAIAGADAVNLSKDLSGPSITIIGWIFDLPSQQLRISERSYLKLVCCFFVETPAEPTKKTKVTIRHLQRLSSLAIRYSQAIPALQSFSRSFTLNLKRIPTHADGSTLIPLHQSTVDAIAMWRTVLMMAARDLSWLAVPMQWPTLLAPIDDHLHIDSASMYQSLWSRQAAAADIVIYSDACRPGDPALCSGGGFYVPPSTLLPFPLWSHFTFPISCDHDINLLECFAGLASLLSTCSILRASSSSVPRAHSVHIHLWTDNVSVQSWLRTHRYSSPLHHFLLILLSYLQVHFNVFVTCGHVPGALNPVADAASRLHLDPDLHTVTLAAAGLNHTNRLPCPQDFMTFFTELLPTSCPDTLQLLQRVSTLLKE